jgi:hypothetical protein
MELTRERVTRAFERPHSYPVTLCALMVRCKRYIIETYPMLSIHHADMTEADALLALMEDIPDGE